jgi:hypothetical protein
MYSDMDLETPWVAVTAHEKRCHHVQGLSRLQAKRIRSQKTAEGPS